MAKKTQDLTAMAIKRLSGQGIHLVGHVPGLGLRIQGGAKDWTLRYSIGKRRRTMSLGAFNSMTLVEAKAAAFAAKEQVRQGIDPLAERGAAKEALVEQQRQDEAKAITFEYCAREVIKTAQAESSNAKHAQQWNNTLESYVFPHIGHKPVGEVSFHDVVGILKPLWSEKTETMKRVRGRMEKVFAWAKVNGYRTGDNPAMWRGNLDAILASPRKVAPVKHFPALAVEDIQEFMRLTRAKGTLAAKTLEFAILTGNRIGSVVKARWKDIDIEKAVWNVPAEDMKMRKPYKFPLSTAAIEVLKSVYVEGSEFVFKYRQRKHISEESIKKVRQEIAGKMGVQITTHGFRSTVTVWASEYTSADQELRKQFIAHSTGGDNEEAYFRSDLLHKRALLAQQWADFIDQKPSASTVTPIGAAKHG